MRDGNFRELGRSSAATAGLFVSALTLASLVFAGVANAVVFNNRGAFEATLGTSITDDYSNSGYLAGDLFNGSTNDRHSDANMSAIFGETLYTATRFAGNSRIVNQVIGNPAYCAGFNGSFLLDFTATSIGGANGVFGVGFDLPHLNNSTNPDSVYIAFITFGDGSTANIAVADTSLAGDFWGITDPLLIASIHFGGRDGAVRSDGIFAIDNLTIGTQAQVLPEPSAVLLFGLGLVGLGFAMRRAAKVPATAAVRPSASRCPGRRGFPR